ncbi:MAG TPA: sigma-70 family RNA polymerase sigma factor [Sphingomicrobium sp.]
MSRLIPAQDSHSLAREGEKRVAGDRRSGRAPASGTSGGEEPFVESLAVRYRGALERFFARRAGRLGDTEDLTQEVFLRLATRGAGEPIERIDGYIFQTAANVLTDRARRVAVRAGDRHVCYEEDQHAVEDFSPERVLLAREQVAMVRMVLERLPDRVRAAFVLHRFEELGYAEIAKRLGVSVSSIEKYISQALKELTAARMRDEL